MESELFLSRYHEIKQNLIGQRVASVSNSIGSNVFFDFGAQNKKIGTNRKEYIYRDWSIWIGAASWRISQNHEYIIGSADPSEGIQLKLALLLDKKLIDVQIISPFLEIKLLFEDSFEVSTFFHWKEENQWTILFPDRTSISIDSIHSYKEIANQISVVEPKMEKAFLDCCLAIQNVEWSEKISIHLINQKVVTSKCSAWRVEKKGEYLIGSFDLFDHQGYNYILLDDKKIEKIMKDEFFFNTSIHIEEGVILRTFKRSKDDDPIHLLRI